jgi:putative sigma-54 modulation protein
VQITFRSRHFELTDGLKSVTTEKITRLARFLPGMDHADVTYSEEKNKRISSPEVCEVTMSGHGHHIRAKAGAATAAAALDLVVDKLDHQLHSLKGKLDGLHHGGPKRGKHHHPGIHVVNPLVVSELLTDRAVVNIEVNAKNAKNGSSRSALAVAEPSHLNGNGGGSQNGSHAEDDDNVARIVKTKQFTVSTMCPDDAALQMDLLQHDFFLFTNTDTGAVAVLYRRDDGHLGLIDTK